jgi:hypothetical protein
MQLRVSFEIEWPLRDLLTKLEAEQGLAPKDVLLLLMRAHESQTASNRPGGSSNQPATRKMPTHGKEAWAFHEITLSKPQSGPGYLHN